METNKIKPFHDISDEPVARTFKAGRRRIDQKAAEEWLNEPYQLPKDEQLRLDLFMGKIVPRNEKEKAALASMRKAEREGRMVNFKGEAF